MRASLLIAAHNEGDSLWKTIRACVEGCAGLDYEIVVADDASTDGSVRAAEQKYPQIRIACNERRQGASPTKHLAAVQARGDVLVFLDGHCNPEPGSIRRLVEDVEELAGRAIITPRIPALSKCWTNKSSQVGHGYRLGLETFDCGWLPLEALRVRNHGNRRFYESPALIGCALAIARELYDELHGFDPHMFYWGVEDLDFGLRCWLLGHPILHDPEAAIGHRFRQSFDNYSVPFDHLVVNQMRMARKCFTQSVWSEWLERCRQRSPQALQDHPEGFWAHAWELFQEHRASAESERAYIHARRERDEFWYAERFGLAWPKFGGTAAPRAAPRLDQPSPSPPPIAVRILRGGIDITNTTTTVIVGQLIALAGQVSPSGANQSDSWSVPGNPAVVKSYSQSEQTAEFEPLEASDLTESSVSFYWIAGASGVHITYTVVVDGATYSAAATFNILRPTATFTSTSTTAVPPVDISDEGLGDGITLHCGTFAHPGLTWSGTVTAPAGGTGLVATTQLIKTDRSTTRANGTTDTTSSHGEFVSDNVPNEERGGGFVNTNTITDIVGSGSSTCGTDDEPSEGVAAGDLNVSADDRFRLYLMYRPEGDDSIWVSLSVIKWRWSGSATWNNATAKWSMDPGAKPPPVNPAGSDTTELPHWTNFFSNL